MVIILAHVQEDPFLVSQLLVLLHAIVHLDSVFHGIEAVVVLVL